MSDRAPPLRYLAVDLGTKRIGLAISTPEGIVSALKVIPAPGEMRQTARLVLEIAGEYDAQALVIGLPLNMDGTHGPQAAQSHALAAGVRSLAPALQIYLHDERLTSHAADCELAGRELTRRQKKNRQDAVAARVLLESFLAAESPSALP